MFVSRDHSVLRKVRFYIRNRKIKHAHHNVIFRGHRRVERTWAASCPNSACAGTLVSVNYSKTSFKFLTAAAVFLFAVNAGGAPPELPKVPVSVESITPAELRMHLEFLASPELGGRYTLSPAFPSRRGTWLRG